MKKTNKTEVVEVVASVEKKEFPKIVDKDYKANAYVVDYRTASERKARLAEMGRQVPEIEKNSGEARVIIEGRPYWVVVNFGRVYKGSRLNVTYLKDDKGEIYRRSITAVKPESK